MPYERQPNSEGITFEEETQLERLAFVHESEKSEPSASVSEKGLYPRSIIRAVNYAVKQEAINGERNPKEPDPLKGLNQGDYKGLKAMLMKEAKKLMGGEGTEAHFGKRFFNAINAIPDKGKPINIAMVRASQVPR